MLRISNLSFSYGPVKVLSDISLHVEKGALCGLFGPNGSGKTTLFKCALRFLRNYTGIINIQGRNISKLKVEEVARVVSYVPQEHRPPFPYLASEVVLMGRSPYLGGIFGLSREDEKIAMDAMDLIGISDIADIPYTMLSGGQRQMVLIARSLAQKTQAIFLDEPTAALDYHNQHLVWKVIRDIADDGMTILACTHNPNHVSWYCDHAIVMSRNGIIGAGDPRDVMSQDILNTLYSGSCAIRKLDGIPLILPRDVISRTEVLTGDSM
ncbi:ABC transporter ATP-binding protein [Methanospirillum sp.]|uniref:ABC transporter ATP-binding protein n=1 Tax=Methanospirillum sp. TaxID=45200 RepID=UPI002BC843C8|nr:ABC transporter ATP-binding protein [Methanospirillum sp.]HPP78113.1 ABC transporter ATP-binding protein [Methanospirillum sp.]